MSALDEGLHEVGIDIVRIPQAADTWVFSEVVMMQATP